MVTINIYDLEQALVLQYGSEEFSDLRNILFYEDFMNDCYKKYWFDDDLNETEDNAAIINCVNAFLRDIFPDEECVLIDVSW
jgi:hypothetical protein